MEKWSRHDTYKTNGVYRTTHENVVDVPRIWAKKLIRAAHAKEKQLLENSCHRPNRLNLLDSTAGRGRRSNFFTKNSCLLRFRVQRLNELRQTLGVRRFLRRAACTLT